MPVVGIYTKDFPPIGRALLDTDIIVVAIAGDPVTYRSTVSEIRTSLVSAANATDSELTITTLNSTYASAGLGFQVICESITDNPLIYIKTPSGWGSIPIGGVAP